MGTTKKTRKRTAKPKAKAEEPQEAAQETQVLALPFGAKPAPVVVPDDGTLLRKDGDPTVYVMREGQRRSFASAEAFTACGFGWNEIVVLPPIVVDKIPVGPEVVYARDL